MSMIMGIELMAPHGGIFVLPLVSKPMAYLLALVVGVAVTTALVLIVKPDLEDTKATDTEEVFSIV